MTSRHILLGTLGILALGLASCEDRDTNNPFAGRNGDGRTEPFGDGPSGTSTPPTLPAVPDTSTH